MKKEKSNKVKNKVKKKEEVKVTVLPINLQVVKITLKGTMPLLMDKFPEATKNQILQKQMGGGRATKSARDIKKEVDEAVHRLPNGKPGYPAGGIKAGLIECTSFVGDKFFSKKLVRGIQFINAVNGLIPIKFAKQDICEHSIGSNTKFSPQFHDWSCELEIQFDGNNLNAGDLITLANYSGFYQGLGIWSPRCKSGGTFGMFEVQMKKGKK